MKKSDIIFWTILAAIAAFLIFKGNDVHRDYYEYIKKVGGQHQVTQKENQEKE